MRIDLLYSSYNTLNIGCGKKFVAFFQLDGIKCSATTNCIGNTRRALKSDILIFVLSRKRLKSEKIEVDQKLFYFENRNK